ncbi:DUF2510 domain-containing protein [Streptomyces sp. NPDC046860]|uniref:DUF2510 domain-containing protein n=1 Tax=Streptomyces sp. NPDC046860 TaxID=3154495 RepID=UPI0033CA82F3
MTQVTPPGWYPDPGQTHDAPPTERWWDGTAWTAQVRPAGADPAGAAPDAPRAQPAPPAYGGPPAYPPHAYPGYPGHPGYPAKPPAGSRRGLRTGIAVAAAAAVLACTGVGVYALAQDSGGGDRADARPGQGQGQEPRQDGPGGRGPRESPSPERSAAPKVRGGGTVRDPVNGISVPVPEGWTGQAFAIGAQVTSDKSYACPGDPSKTCTAGGAYSAPALALGTRGTTAEEVAKADVAANAEESYGGKSYGAVTSHRELAARAVTVAGQKGYLVRWKAVTSKGADGYVESAAFPSPADPSRILVVRFGLDVGQSTAVMDEILKGIKVSAGGGAGQDV